MRTQHNDTGTHKHKGTDAIKYKRRDAHQVQRYRRAETLWH